MHHIKPHAAMHMFPSSAGTAWCNDKFGSHESHDLARGHSTLCLVGTSLHCAVVRSHSSAISPRNVCGVIEDGRGCDGGGIPFRRVTLRFPVMKFRSVVLLVLLVVTSGLPLLAATAECATMPGCHSSSAQRIARVMDCCKPQVSCSPEQPEAQPATTTDQARVAVVVALIEEGSERLALPVVQQAHALDTSPPPPTRLRLAQLATLLI